jgi:hypothetical protein
MTAPSLLDELEPCPFCGRGKPFDQWPCEWLDGSGANVIRCAWCHGAAPANVWNRRTHHATIADMAKRLEAAERKVSRLTAMRNEWERDAREHLMTFGQHLPASVECLVERFDAAIDATQEGEE